MKTKFNTEAELKRLEAEIDSANETKDYSKFFAVASTISTIKRNIK